MQLKKGVRNIYKVVLPLLLGGAILYWMYRDFDFKAVKRVATEEMNWWWMLASFPFGVLAQTFRGWRWKQTLEPLGERPRTSTCVNSIFLSYAVSLVIPRIGEFARCGVLKRQDGVSFPKAVGTVVMERAIDSLLVIIVTGLVIMSQLGIFNRFFNATGVDLKQTLYGFSWEGYLVTAACGIIALLFIFILLRRLALYEKVKHTAKGLFEGVTSLKNVRNIPLFIFFSVAIWMSYFLHYYLTFFCFEATSGLGVMCALVTFIVGSIAVIVPTPNGAGPWHFAVKTMLVLYGVAATDALYFVLIVHTVQTLLVIALGVYAWIRISLQKKI